MQHVSNPCVKINNLKGTLQGPIW